MKGDMEDEIRLHRWNITDFNSCPLCGGVWHGHEDSHLDCAERALGKITAVLLEHTAYRQRLAVVAHLQQGAKITGQVAELPEA